MRLNPLLLFFALAILLNGPVQASSLAVRTADIASALQLDASENKAETRLEKKLEKKLAKWEKKLAKKGEQIDFTHPTDKWLWYAIFGFGAAILISIFFWELGSVVAFLALISLIVWIVKKSGA